MIDYKYRLWWCIRTASRKIKGNKSELMWGMISKLCALGSTSSTELARDLGIDPNKTVKEWLEDVNVPLL